MLVLVFDILALVTAVDSCVSVSGECFINYSADQELHFFYYFVVLFCASILPVVLCGFNWEELCHFCFAVKKINLYLLDFISFPALQRS